MPDAPASLEVLVRRLDPDVPLPSYALPGDAGADIVTVVDVELSPGERAVVPTGLAIAVPDGFAAFVHPRSGLAARCGMSLVNAPGTIDAGYRGEVRVIVLNQDPRQVLRLSRGDRIAQLVIQRVERARFRAVDALPDSVRGTGGHGSTGGFSEATEQGSIAGPSGPRSGPLGSRAVDSGEATEQGSIAGPSGPRSGPLGSRAARPSGPASSAQAEGVH